MGKATASAVLMAMILISQCVFLISPEDLAEAGIDENVSSSSDRNTAIADLPSWRVGDRWIYDGYLDVGDFVSSSGVSTNVQYLTGTLDRTVTDIYTTTVDNRSTLVYEAQSQGTYEAQNVNLDGNNGDLEIEMDTTELIRASDLAVIEQEATIEIDFGYRIFWWTINIDVAELTITQTYSPPTEGYDFPLTVGDYWTSNYYQETEYEGSSDFVDIPADSDSSELRSWQVMSRGAPGTPYAQCQQSYNVTTFDANGSADGYRWFCPAVRGDVSSSTDIIDGINAFHELQNYIPEDVARSKEISVDLEFPLSPLDLNTTAILTVTQDGSALSAGSQEVEFRYGIDGDIRTVTTSSNGTAYVEFNSGNSIDDSQGGSEAGSHGVIAWIPSQKIVGVSTITIDPNVSAVDLVAISSGVTVERTRGGSTTTLASSTGFNAVPQDTLRFYMPIQNRGLLPSPATTMNVESPDGSVQTAQVPSLPSLGQAIVEVNWTVPNAYPIGQISLSFQVDPNESITDDGDRSNNNGVFSLWIGRLPVATLDMPAQSLTKSAVILDASSSYDPDGGEFIGCNFFVENEDGIVEISGGEECIVEFEWDDDGIFDIVMEFTDNENDLAVIGDVIEIVNRPPEITIESEYEWTNVLSPLQFNVEERSDVDTQNPQAPMDILWISDYPCQEGQVGVYCTVTPEEEGEYTISVEAVDDDGDIGYSNKTVEVRNIAPTNPRAEVWKEGNRMVPDSRGVYVANEGDLLMFEGMADDSENDLSSLLHLWSPDAENNPDQIITFEGRKSTVQHTYHTSGLHLATLQVVDNDGASTESLIIPIEIVNLEPQISPVADPLPVAEDSEISITIDTIDTAGDQLTLRNCYDIQPMIDSDGSGNAADDCDIESRTLQMAWPDATTSPSMIVFHVTDDDGSSAMIEIPIDVRNVNPFPKVSASTFNPVEGEIVFFSANGTSDSILDMENMVYNWDMDTSVDSDGDGDATNDIDIQGKWIEWSFVGSGNRGISMTALDEGQGSSATLTLTVSAAPFSLSAFFSSYGIILIIAVLIALSGGFMLIKNRRTPVDSGLVSGMDQTKSLKKVSVDDAFDDPDYDPFDSQSRMDGPKSKTLDPVPEKVDRDSEIDDSQDTSNADIQVDSEKQESESIIEVSDTMNDGDASKLSEEKGESSEDVALSVDDALSEEDIEALFEE